MQSNAKHIVVNFRADRGKNQWDQRHFHTLASSKWMSYGRYGSSTDAQTPIISIGAGHINNRPTWISGTCMPKKRWPALSIGTPQASGRHSAWSSEPTMDIDGYRLMQMHIDDYRRYIMDCYSCYSILSNVFKLRVFHMFYKPAVFPARRRQITKYKHTKPYKTCVFSTCSTQTF